MESLHPALQTGVPSGKRLHLTLQLRGDVQRCCAWSNAVWSYDQQELHPPPLPTDKNPIKRFHQRTFGENVYFKACAPSSPFFGQRLKLSSAPELHFRSLSIGSKDAWHEAPCWKQTQEGQQQTPSSHRGMGHGLFTCAYPPGSSGRTVEAFKFCMRMTESSLRVPSDRGFRASLPSNLNLGVLCTLL